MRFKNQEDFNTQLAEALAGDRLAQARLKEAITSDQLAPMFVTAANVASRSTSTPTTPCGAILRRRSC